MKVFTIWKLNRKRKSRLATIAGAWQAKRALKTARQSGLCVEMRRGLR